MRTELQCAPTTDPRRVSISAPPKRKYLSCVQNANAAHLPRRCRRRNHANVLRSQRKTSKLNVRILTARTLPRFAVSDGLPFCLMGMKCGMRSLRPSTAAVSPRKYFHIVLIKPSHYDDDGYVIRWYRSPMPANSLAGVYFRIAFRTVGNQIREPAESRKRAKRSGVAALARSWRRLPRATAVSLSMMSRL